MSRRYFSSVAQATTITGNINASATSVTVTALTGYPTSFPYTAVIDPDTTDEEIVEVSSASGTTLTIVRGVDGSTGKSHSAGAVFRHAVTGRDFEQLNSYVYGVTNPVVVSMVPSQPSSPANGQIWVDTDSDAPGVNASDYATRANPTFTGVASFPDGSASAPSITNTGDENTGIYFPADNSVGITTDGNQRVSINATGDIGFGVGASSGLFYFLGRDVYVRRDSASSVTSLNTRSATTSHLSILSLEHNNASNSTTPDNADLGGIYFAGRDTGGTYMRPATILASMGTNASGGAPGLLGFYTAPSGSTSPTERMRIDSNGLITGTGTSLGAWTSYTPTLGGTGWGIGNGTLVGAYCRIGKIIIFRAEVTLGSTSTIGSGSPSLTLPVTSTSLSRTNLNLQFADTSLGVNYLGGPVGTTDTVVACRTLTTGGQIVAANATTPFTWDGATGDRIILSGTYEAA